LTGTYIELLERFYRKERGWLIRECTGRSALSEPFCRSLASSFSAPAPNSGAWWAIDYHLDWLAGVSQWRPTEADRVYGDRKMAFSIEDVDLIVATPEHLFLIEAKAAGSWSNAQLASKVARLDNICPGGKLFIPSTGEKVIVHFGILSVRRAARVATSGWPHWAVDGKTPFIIEPEVPGPWTKLAVRRVSQTSEAELRWRIIETAT